MHHAPGPRDEREPPCAEEEALMLPSETAITEWLHLIRAEYLEIRLVDDGDVDSVRDQPAFEGGDDLLGDDDTRSVLGLVGRRGAGTRRSAPRR